MEPYYRLDDRTEFREWTKIPRLNRDIVITEKIDGTNACVIIDEDGEVCAQSRTQLLIPGERDNFGFAHWVQQHVAELFARLGPGYHYGEWYGSKIQRGYGLSERRFALFNTGRWTSSEFEASEKVAYIPRDACGGTLGVVPVLYQGPFGQEAIDLALQHLHILGSAQVHGFTRPEGIVIYHTAAGQYFKVTLEGDESPKVAHKALAGVR